MTNWRLLTSALDSAGKPTLLVRFETHPAGYEVHVTDLVYLWSENLNRKSIIRRALNDDTNIDPSEGPDQLNLLLRHIWYGMNGDPNTTLNVSSRASGKEALELKMKSILPSPLKELCWTFDLQLGSQQEFSREVVMPIIGNLFSARNDAGSLMSIVREKDDALDRIRSSLESAGRSMPELFRGIIPKTSKDTPEEALLKAVPSLEPFDEDSWAEMQASAPAKDFKERCEEAFREGQQELPKDVDNVRSIEAWWNELGSGVDIEPTIQPSPPKPPPLKQQTSSAGFASQDSPLNETLMPSPNPIPPKPKEDGQEVEDSDATASTASDLETNVRQKSPSPSQQAPVASQNPARKLGMLGGNKRTTTSKSRSPSPNAIPSKRGKSPNLGLAPTQNSPPRQPSAQHQTHRSPPTPSPAPEATASSSSTAPPKATSKLGRIGGSQPPLSQPKSLSQSHQLASRSGTSHKKDNNGEDGEDTEDELEAADRRREELKRKLEEKRNAPGKKKARKF